MQEAPLFIALRRMPDEDNLVTMSYEDRILQQFHASFCYENVDLEILRREVRNFT